MKAKKPMALLHPILAMLPPLVAFILQSMLWSVIQPYVWFLFSPAIFFSSWIGGLASGLMATVISTAIVWWFFVPLEHSFLIKNPWSLVSAGVFMGMGVLFSCSHNRLRKATKQAADALAAVSVANDQLETRVRERTEELSQANESLRESETRLRTVTDTAQVGLVIVDQGHRYRYANHAYAAILGLPTDKIVGQRVADVLAPVYADQIRPRLERAFRGVRVNYELLLPSATPDEEERQYEVSYELGMHRSEPVVLVVIVDITERKRVEESLRKSEAKLQTIVENLSEGVAVADLNGQLLHFNRAALEIHGFASQDECLRHLTEFADIFELAGLGGTVWPVDQWPLARILRGEKVRDLEVCIRRIHTDWRRVFSYGGTLVCDADGQPLMAVVTISDISERKQAEEALQENQARMGGIVNSAMDAVISVDSGQRIVLFNAAAEKMFQCSSAKALGQSVEMFIPQRFREEHRHHVQGFGKTGVTARSMRSLGELSGLRADGEEFPIEASISQIDVNGQKLFTVILRDITARKHAEEALLEARDTLEQRVRERTAELATATEHAQAADRLKSEFLANMSHELRTPLNAIIGFSQLMHDGKVGPVSSAHKEYLGDVLTSARHLLQLINDVLDLSKVEAGKMEFIPEPVHLSKVIAEVRQILQTLAAHKRLNVEIEIAPAVDQVIIDPAKLKQVLYNYLSNAIKFTSEKGWITLRARADGSDSFRLEVEDTGIGIAPDQIEKLFTEFQQLDASTAKKHQGTGLGLALTKRIVEAQGGHVGVQSVVGQGSVFYAVLPKITERKTETSAERHMIAAPATAIPSVLIVEHSERDLQWIAKILSEQGHSLDTARTGAEALAKAEARVYSAILLDLVLPDMIGWDVLHSIRMEGANQYTPVIIVTVVAEKEMARGFPIQDYLTKPLSPESLIDSLKRARIQGNGAKKKVLVVDDDPNALEIAKAALQSRCYEAVCHTGGKSGLAAAAESNFDAIVLDLLMPEIDGFEFLDRFREIAGCRDTPIIVWMNEDITAEDRDRLKNSAQLIVSKASLGLDAVLRELWLYVDATAETLGSDPCTIGKSPSKGEIIREPTT